MSASPRVSVIVPIYGTEAYIDQCLESIAAQTFEEFEAILVDDRSPDNAWAVAEKFAAGDPRFRLIRHERNLGLGGARNTAIAIARGEYLAGVDSDDWARPNMLERLWVGTENGHYDIVVCGFEHVDAEGGTLGRFRGVARTIDRWVEPTDIFETTNPSFWNKLWRKELYAEIRFPEKVFFQDLATTPRVVSKARRIRYLDELLYYYRARAGSATLAATDKHILDYFRVYYVLLDFLVRENLWEEQAGNFRRKIEKSLEVHSKNILEREMTESQKEEYLRLLLLLKLGFLEQGKALLGLSAERLMEHLRPRASERASETLERSVK